MGQKTPCKVPNLGFEGDLAGGILGATWGRSLPPFFAISKLRFGSMFWSGAKPVRRSSEHNQIELGRKRESMDSC